MAAATAKGFRGKVVDLSPNTVIATARQSRRLSFMMIRAKKTKPSSQATSPIEQTGFHHSHLEGKVVWGHQFQATVVQSGGISLIHAMDLYDKKKPTPMARLQKIDHVCDRAATLPLPPHSGYVLVDSWFTCPRVIDSYTAAGYHLIGGLKTNRILYPQGIRISVQNFAQHISKEDVRS